MWRMVAVMAVWGLASGCALFQVDRPIITVDYGAAALAYADAKAAYVLLSKAVGDACAANRLRVQACAEAATVHERVKLSDSFIRSALRDPQRPVDWEKVTALLASVVELALKIAP